MKDAGDFGNTLDISHDNGMGNFSLVDAISDPDATIEKYKTQAMQMGTQLVIIQAAAFAIMVYLIMRNTKVRGVQQ